MSAARKPKPRRRANVASKLQSNVYLAEHMLANAAADLLESSQAIGADCAEALLRGLAQIDQARRVLIAAAAEVSL